MIKIKIKTMKIMCVSVAIIQILDQKLKSADIILLLMLKNSVTLDEVTVCTIPF